MKGKKWTYYNDIEPSACAWLKALIADGLIPDGEVDGRSICEVRPDDVAGFRAVHFFAGIGGWAYALRLAGWPEDREVWTASCPCQPFSVAGADGGLLDERHLWPAVRGLVAERRPSIIFGEQVASKAGRAWLAGVRSDMEGMGFAVGGADLCAPGVGAPHIRQRLYWVADAAGARFGAGEDAGTGGGYEAADGRRSVKSKRGGTGDWVADAERDGGRADEPERGAQGRAAAGRLGAGRRVANPGQQRKRRGDTGPGEGAQPDGGGAPDQLGRPGAAVRRLADAPGGGRPKSGPGTAQPGAEPDGQERGGGVGDADDAGREEQRGAEPAQGREEQQRAERGGHAGGLEHAALPKGARQRQQQKHLLGSSCEQFWTGAVWVECADGRRRRVGSRVCGVDDGLPDFVDESGCPRVLIRPLGPKVKGRVALLKGYGNAIVPVLAAEFVRAYAEARGLKLH